MVRPTRVVKDTHALLVQVPVDFWDELIKYFHLRKSYTSYAELSRYLMRVGLDTLKGRKPKNEPTIEVDNES